MDRPTERAQQERLRSARRARHRAALAG